MIGSRFLSTKARAWFAVGAWTALIFVSVPLVRGIREPVAELLGAAAFGWLTIAGLLTAGVAVVWIAAKRVRRIPVGNLVALTIVGVISLFATVQLWQRPEEAVHLLEYGILGVLITRALRHHDDDSAQYLVAIAIGAMIGTIDEVLQFVTPLRFFDFRDVWLNAAAVALAQVAVCWGIPRDTRIEPPSAAGLARACRFAAGLLVMLGLCLAATPARLGSLSDRFGWIDPLLDPNDAIAEYGYRHVFPGHGDFKSRLTLDQLRQIDTERGVEAGSVVKQHRYRYLEFLELYSPGDAPFIYEAQVHLQSRDANIELAKREPADSQKQREHLTRAFRENQILEAFYPATLRHAEARLTRQQETALSDGFLPDYRFVSLAGIRIITFATEVHLRLGLAILLVVLLTSERLLTRRAKRS